MEGPESAQPPRETVQYEQVHRIVAAQFTVEEGFIEYNTPTFFVTPQPNLKQAFLRLYKQLDSMQLVPVLRKRENKVMLQVVAKPPVRPSRPLINLVLLVATIGTTLITGYLLSQSGLNPWVDAIMFSTAIMSILGAHEMGHKLTADRHKVEATYPYFIPGVPPLPTFGAVIQQKSLPPNKDALFDLGISGPLIGFLVTIIVTIVGIKLSVILPTAPEETAPLVTPLLFDFLTALFPPVGEGSVLLVHPVAYAGYIGMIVTMLNLVPIGQLDGGHIAHVLLGETKTRFVLSFVAMISLLFISWPMALIAYFLSQVRHPGSLDDVSKLSRSRKLATMGLVVIFVLSVAPVFPLFSLF